MKILLPVVLLTLAGCAVERPMQWDTIGGSRAAATITLGYQYNPMTTKPVTSLQQALEVAKQRCQAWGYTDAEPFSMETKQCQQVGSGLAAGGCLDQIVQRQFQCTRPE